MRRILVSAVFLCSLAALALPGCGGGDASDEQGGAGQGGASAGGGSGGSKPDAGKGGADAAVGGSSGSAGKAGAAGAAGAGGSTGYGGNAGVGGAAGQAGMAGSSGQAGTAGSAGEAGSAGSAGEAGAAGSDNDAGVGGAAGEAGAAGASGTGGAAGSGSGGAVGCALPCHGSNANAAPPKSLSGKTDPTAPSVGAHQAHLTDSSWHLDVTCDQCHKVPAAADDPAVPTHMNGARDLIWGSVAQSGTYSKPAYTCTGSYCHGGTLEPDIAGKTSNRIPTWNVVDGSQSACGTNCHTLPPGGAHPASDGCPTCHGSVISSFTPGNPPTVVWANPDLHIDGKLAVSNLNCTSCHGDKVTNNPAPPFGVNGETLTTQSAVGAHAVHLAAGSTWHRDGQCVDCHTSPSSMTHSNGAVDFTWGLPSSADGMTPSFADATSTCANAYCHGASLQPAKAGGTINRTPIWTKVDGTQDSCGNTCHTNPPGGTHPTHADCTICHKAVIATFVPATNTATWLDRAKHVNGIVESNAYHDLASWTSPKNGTNHHGSNYFLTNQQRDEHNTACTACHGADLNGGTVGVSCNNVTCHKSDWKSCSFCHGTPPSQNNPPEGVGGETTIGTLAVGRHARHLAGSANYPAVACGTCHQVPAAGDVSHALGYVPTPSLATAGHHGDVTFLAGSGAQGMTWNVNQTQGAPVTARGTCVLGCHSNGRGGNPLVLPYWAGGTWTSSCGNCHQAVPTTNRHDKHVNGENMACTECHPPANSSQHMDGKWSLLGTIHGTVTTIPPGGVCGTHWGCTGTCHGTSHSPECWNQ